MTYTSNNGKHKAYIKSYGIYLDTYKKEITNSKRNLRNDKVPFFVLYKEFVKYIPQLSNNSIKLYLYIGFNINYRKGYFIGDLEDISTFFNRSIKTIKAWIIELQNANLVWLKLQDGILYIFISPYNGNLQYNMNDSVATLSKVYRSWINAKKWSNIESRELFFILPVTFKSYLNKLKSGSIKLYIYCLLSADVMEGFFHKSLETISHDMKVCNKTLTTLFKDLQRFRLVDRFQLKFNGCTYTHIIPIKYH